MKTKIITNPVNSIRLAVSGILIVVTLAGCNFSSGDSDKDSKINSLETDNTSLKNNVSSLENQVTTLQAKVKSMETDINALKSEVGNLSTKMLVR